LYTYVVSKYGSKDGTVYDLIDTCEEWMDEINEFVATQFARAKQQDAALDSAAY